MSKRPYPNSMYCPCGSNRKYKSCCAAQGIEYFIKPDGKIIKHEPMTEAQRAHYQEQLQIFVTENKRPPTDEEDAILRAKDYQTVEKIIIDDMVAHGAGPEAVYAFKKTGIMVTRENKYQIPAEELKRWQEAVDEFRRQQNQ